MVTRVNSSLPVVNPTRSYATPILAALVFAAIGYLLLQVVRSLIGRVQPKMQLRAKILADHAAIHIEKKQFNAAHADFLLALSYKPTTDVRIGIYVNRADLFMKQNKHAQALDDFNAAFALDSTDKSLRARILVCKAETNIKMGQLWTVLKDLSDALALSRADPSLRRCIYRVRGDFYTLTSSHALAANDYTRVLSDPPYDGEVVYKRGRSYAALERWNDALQDFTSALAADFSDDQLRANILKERAKVYFKRGENQRSANDLTAAIAFKPSEALDQLLQMRAVVFATLKQYSEAIKDFTAVLEMCSEDQNYKAHILHQRGIAHRENKSLDLARQDFQAALKCNITKEGLREEISADLTPQTPPAIGESPTLWGRLSSLWQRTEKK